MVTASTRGHQETAGGAPCRLSGMSEVPAALVLGWLADRAVGDPARGHPVAAFRRPAGGLDARMWRPLRLAGAPYAGALVGPSGVVTALAWRLTDGHPAARLALGSAVVWM